MGSYPSEPFGALCKSVVFFIKNVIFNVEKKVNSAAESGSTALHSGYPHTLGWQNKKLPFQSVQRCQMSICSKMLYFFHYHLFLTQVHIFLLLIRRIVATFSLRITSGKSCIVLVLASGPSTSDIYHQGYPKKILRKMAGAAEPMFYLQLKIVFSLHIESWSIKFVIEYKIIED